MIARIPLTDEDRLLAEKTFKIKQLDNSNIEEWEYNKTGNAGEIIVSKFIGQIWEPKFEPDTGVDIYWKAWDKTIQVKTVKIDNYKSRSWLETRKNTRFDLYALVLIAQDYSYGEIILLGDKSVLELNAQTDDKGRLFLLHR